MEITKCIKSRTIQLRVRRKSATSNEIPPDSGEAGSKDIKVTDAYLVSVNAEHKAAVRKVIQTTYPSIRTHDMESVHRRLVSGRNPIATTTADSVDMNEDISIPPSQDIMPKHTNGHPDEERSLDNSSVHETSSIHEQNLLSRQQSIKEGPQFQNGATDVDNVGNASATGSVQSTGRVKRRAPDPPVDGNVLVQKTSNAKTTAPTDIDSELIAQYSSIIKHQDRPTHSESGKNDRIVLYENELRERNDRNEERSKQTEFLRNSVRSSKRLQALEKPKKGDGNADESWENPCYEEGQTLELHEIQATVERVTQKLENCPEYRKDVEFIQQLFSQKPVQNAVDLTNLLHKCLKNKRGELNAQKEVPDMGQGFCAADQVLQELSEAVSDQAAELQALLENNHIQALLYAHDSIANQASHFCEPSTSMSNITTSTYDNHPDGYAQMHKKSSHSKNGGPVLGVVETAFGAASLELQGRLRIVKLYKASDSFLGATVRCLDGQTIQIGRIVKGGIAEKTGLLKEGDEILEVQGNDLRGSTVNQVCELLRHMSGEIEFIIVPAERKHGDQCPLETAQNVEEKHSKSVMHLRALFDYDPEDDYYTPCRELAVKFQKGDILHIMDRTDENWWQAYRQGDDPNCTLAGLIPSPKFQMQRELYQRELESENGHLKQPNGSQSDANVTDADKKSSVGCAPTADSLWRCSKKRKRPSFKGGKNADARNGDVDDVGYGCDEDIPTYEQVGLHLVRTSSMQSEHQKQGFGRRPVVLSGPTNVGCLELRQRLMDCHPQRFTGVVPYTTRARRAGEQDAVHYNFVTKQHFTELSKSAKFVEWGEYNKNFYGTTFDGIRSALQGGKTCVLTLKAQSIRALRNTDLMPYVVYISPPSFHQLKSQKLKLGQSDVKDDDLKTLIEESRRDQRKYGHLFDLTLVNIDPERTYEDLRLAIHRLETEPQWVPIAWLQHNDANILAGTSQN